MAGPSGNTDRPLVSLVFNEAYRFDFFQAVRLLERLQPSKAPVGRDSSPGQEVVRFQARASLEFPASQVHEVVRDTSEEPSQPVSMVVNFMGLTGPSAVLPTPYTELLIERIRYRDTALRDFLDLFNHRLISLFYRAWEKINFPVAFERDRKDPITGYVFDLIGMGTGGLRGRMGLQDEGLLLYAGLMAQRPHSSTAIEQILSDYFEVPVSVQQFSGQWLDIDEESLTRLGNANSELGVNAIAGTRFWDRQSRFRLRLGALRFSEFKAFLPNGSGYHPLKHVTRLLAGMEFDFDIQLVLQAQEVPPCQLSTEGGFQPLLGWTTWLKTRPLVTDDPQLVLAAKN
ncbi:MAG: type VI secretion system baseplate subunit TssG [Acidobacteriota bacterium]